MSQALVKACLNGGTQRSEHPAVPLAPDELAEDGRRCVEGGAGALHFHVRQPDGSETLESEPTAAAVEAVRSACPRIPLGLTTALWTAGSPARRLELVAAWTMLPDFVSVNVSEPGWEELGTLLLERGIGIEAGVWTVEDARALSASELRGRCLRVLAEPGDEDADAAVARARGIDEELVRGGVDLPQVHHGYGHATWAVIEAALARGHGIRIGLEDATVLADGSPASGNAELVDAAMALARG